MESDGHSRLTVHATFGELEKYRRVNGMDVLTAVKAP
jgi:hypothetical protein